MNSSRVRFPVKRVEEMSLSDGSREVMISMEVKRRICLEFKEFNP